VNEGGEHDIEFIETGKDPSKTFESAKKAFHFVALSVHRAIILPRINTVGFRWYDGDVAEIQGQLSGFIALVGSVHDERTGLGNRAEIQQELPASRGIVGLTGR
jgi:hypothetical protein